MNAVVINTMYKEQAFGGLLLVKHMPSQNQDLPELSSQTQYEKSGHCSTHSYPLSKWIMGPGAQSLQSTWKVLGNREILFENNNNKKKTSN